MYAKSNFHVWGATVKVIAVEKYFLMRESLIKNLKLLKYNHKVKKF